MILSPSGQLIWFDQLPNAGFAYNFQEQQYQGQPVLTFWEGGSGRGAGYDVMLNNRYQQIATVQPGGGWLSDEHDFELTPAGTALITVQKLVPGDLRPVGGPRHGMVHDMGIQEVQVSTGQVVWQWDAMQHVSLGASYAGKPGRNPYDFLHMNSVQELPDGNLLVSSRHTWTVYEISRATGKVLWQLGGKHSSFRIGRGANFEWQHDAHLQPDGHTLTVFDNGSGRTVNERQSRALVIYLNFKTMRATLIHAYTNNPPLRSSSQGSIEPLPDGNAFVGWGYQPYFTEFSRSGRQLFSLHFPAPIQTYRAYRFQWWGLPTTMPSLAVAPTKAGTRVYASWNGATGVANWIVLGGSDQGSLSEVAEFPKASFETQIWLRTTQPYLQLQAVDQSGNVLGTSPTVSR